MCVYLAGLDQALAESLRHPPNDFQRSFERCGSVHFRSSFPCRNMIILGSSGPSHTESALFLVVNHMVHTHKQDRLWEKIKLEIEAMSTSSEHEGACVGICSH
jgi:hypothetical protein